MQLSPTPTERFNDLLERNQYAGAEAFLATLPPDDATTHYLRGRLLWRLGNRAGAITEYNHAVALDPHSPAAIALEQAHLIQDFYNPDLLNP